MNHLFGWLFSSGGVALIAALVVVGVVVGKVVSSNRSQREILEGEHQMMERMLVTANNDVAFNRAQEANHPNSQIIETLLERCGALEARVARLEQNERRTQQRRHGDLAGQFAGCDP